MNQLLLDRKSHNRQHACSQAMRVVSESWHSLGLQTMVVKKRTKSKSRTAAASGPLCVI
jgi:hypothetical protein